MRAKFIYEKFTSDSDPVGDLGIGIVKLLENLPEKIVEIDKKLTKSSNFQYQKNNPSAGKYWENVLSLQSHFLRGYNISKTHITLFTFCDIFRYESTEKKVDKVEYCKQILQKLNLEGIIDFNNVSFLNNRGKKNKYTAVAVKFKINPQNRQHFKGILGEVIL